MVHIKSIQINMFYYVCKKIRFDKIKIYLSWYFPSPVLWWPTLPIFYWNFYYEGLRAKTLRQNINIDFFLGIPHIKSGRREQDGQALNGPHNKSNIKTAGSPTQEHYHFVYERLRENFAHMFRYYIYGI